MPENFRKGRANLASIPVFRLQASLFSPYKYVPVRTRPAHGPRFPHADPEPRFLITLPRPGLAGARAVAGMRSASHARGVEPASADPDAVTALRRPRSLAPVTASGHSAVVARPEGSCLKDATPHPALPPRTMNAGPATLSSITQRQMHIPILGASHAFQCPASHADA